MKKNYFLLLLISCCTHLLAQEETTNKPSLPNGYQAKIDEVYNTIGGWKGKEDIYYNPQAPNPLPVVFTIHGGGWNHGAKESYNEYKGAIRLGYAAVNIEYRFASVATAPAAIEDVRAAILYTVQHAKEYNINPNKIIITGASAGGHLALMAGLLQNDHRFDGNFKNVNNFTITAIIDRFGPADLAIPGIERNNTAATWLGSYAGNLELEKTVSPIYYVKKTSPPIFIVHGDADPTVPYKQSVALQKKLDEMGVKNKFITIEGGGHGGFTKEKNTEVAMAIVAFLREVLN